MSAFGRFDGRLRVGSSRPASGGVRLLQPKGECACPKCYTSPRNNSAFWAAKQDYNRVHDRAVNRLSRSRDWRVLLVWGHSLAGDRAVAGRIERALLLAGKSGIPHGATRPSLPEVAATGPRHKTGTVGTVNCGYLREAKVQKSRPKGRFFLRFCGGDEEVRDRLYVFTLVSPVENRFRHHYVHRAVRPTTSAR